MPLVSITRQLTSRGIAERFENDSSSSSLDVNKANKKKQRATSLAFFEIVFDDIIANAVVAYLRDAAQHNRRFLEVNFYLVPRTPQFDRVLQEVIQLDLFDKIFIKGTRDPNYQQPSLRSMILTMETTTTSLRCLTKLQLSYMNLSTEDTSTLKRLLIQDDQSPTTTSSSIEQLLLSDVTFVEDGALEELTQGFQSTSLKVIAMTSCSLSDEDMARIFDSLTVAASLHTIRLFGNQCRQKGLTSLATLLSNKNCKLRSLDIHHQFLEQQRRRRQQRLHVRNNGGGVAGGIFSDNDDDSDGGGGGGDSIPRMGLEYFVSKEGWQQKMRRNNSLRRLVLSGNRLTDEDMPHICLLLRRLAGLQELDLDSNQISDHGMSLLAEHKTPSRLRILRLSQNPITRKSSESVIRILETHPELYTIVSRVYWQSLGRRDEKDGGDGARISQLFDINRAGRVLLVQQALTARALPLSAWPRVLARVNFVNNNGNRYFWRGSRFARENGIYYLLRHGPVLLERGGGGGTPIISGAARQLGELHASSKDCRKRKRDDACA